VASAPSPFFFSRCCRRLEDSFNPINFAMKCLTEMPHAPLDCRPRKRQKMDWESGQFFDLIMMSH
jgi:hypothetical protein